MTVVNMKRDGSYNMTNNDDTPIEKPAYKAEFGLSPTITGFIPSASTWAALAVGISAGLLIGFYIARK